jgi:hypothetical protein
MLYAATASIAAAFPTISNGSIPLKVSKTAAGNLLPQFRFQLSQVEGGSNAVNIGGGLPPKSPFLPTDSAPEVIWDHASGDLHAPNLPYLTQDDWSCEREPTNVSVITYEDEHLRLSITPQWGARIWSVYDKARGRDWTFSNPAHQPANIAVLKAWSSGGIEWNWSPGIIGHSVFSESPAWVGVLNTPRGPVVRAWEYDRLNASVWQVDIFLSDGALFVHPKVTNTRSRDNLQGYWWTCVAVPAKPSTRIITPAEWTAQTSSGRNQGSPWPRFSIGDANSTFRGHNDARFTDNSFLASVTSGDFFMGPTAYDEHYIAYAETSGFVGYHGHSEKLNGTKFFTWGNTGMGRFMQDFLGGISGPDPIPDEARVGDYAELQVGPAFTQMQTYDLPAASAVQWSEYFSAFDGNTSVTLGVDYDGALDAVSKWRVSAASGVNDSQIDDIDSFLTALADTPVDEILSRGSPWGAVELLRRSAPGGSDGSAPFPTGVKFDLHESNYVEQPWIDLVTIGTFSATTLQSEPSSFQVSTEWLEVLRASAAKYSATWLHDLYTAIILAETGAIDEPLALFNASYVARPSVLAARCLAVMQQAPADARVYYRIAWQLANFNDITNRRRMINLATEIVSFELQLQGDAAADAELRAFLFALPVETVPELAMLDIVLIARATVALAAGDYSTVENILTAPGAAGCFPTIASKRDVLMSLWENAQLAKATVANGGAPLSPWQQRMVRVNHPVPRNIGCPYGVAGDWFAGCTYW